MLREYLYYAYNVPGAFDWSFGTHTVEVRFRDRSIPRQFFTSHNETLGTSISHFKDRSRSQEIAKRVTGLDEWDLSGSNCDVVQMAEEEAEHKLAAYFSLIAPESEFDLGGFSYAEFYKCYRVLLAKALWHRYHAATKGEFGAVVMEAAQLIEAVAEELGLNTGKIELIMRDLVFDERAVKDGLDASYFSLLREAGTGRIWMRPFHFSMHEGLIGFLRVVAKRRSQVFLEQVSQALGDAFVRRIQSSFEAQGFQCRRDVDLTDYDSTLPDIDLVVISEEPTLGYVLLVCELKSPIPAMWAKDHLRALNSDGVSKAFRQSRKIAEFLAGPQGVTLLNNLLPHSGLPDYDHFVVVVEPLIITSHNSGMFFDDESTPIFSFRTLEHMLTAADGDMAYVQHMIATYDEIAEQTLKTAMREVDLGDMRVLYEVVDDSPLLSFPPNQWRSSPTRVDMLEAFRRSGAQPGDAFIEALGGRQIQAEHPGRVGNIQQGGARRLVVLVDRSPDGTQLSRVGHVLQNQERDPPTTE